MVDINGKLRLQRLLEGNCLASNDVHKRATLNPWHHRAVNDFRPFLEFALGGRDAAVIFLIGTNKNHATTGPPERLMRCRRRKICNLDWARMLADRHKACNMCHIYHEICTNLVCNAPEFVKVDNSRIGRCPCNNQLWPVLERQLLNLSVIDGFRIAAHAVAHDIIHLPGKRNRSTVRKVATVRKVHSQNCISWIEGSKQDAHVGLASGMWLDIGMVRAKELFRSVSGQIFGYIDKFAAAIVALAWIAFRILIRKHRAHCFHYSLGCVVLAGDKLELIPLPGLLALHCSPKFRILFFYIGHALLPIY